jgi:hypothetical protein
VFIPARRYVTSAKSAATGYCDRIRIGSNNGLHVGVDVADEATKVHVRTSCADTNNVIGRADPTAGFTAQSDICEAPVVLFMREAEPIAVLLKPLIEKSAKVTDRGVAAARNVAVHSLITKSYVIKAGLIQKQV